LLYQKTEIWHFYSYCINKSAKFQFYVIIKNRKYRGIHMKKLKMLIALLASLLLLSGCANAEEEVAVYYLNFKPEAAATWEKIAEEYTAETGVEVKILTAASGNYEQSLIPWRMLIFTKSYLFW
jgi:hypothetical protein